MLLLLHGLGGLLHIGKVFILIVLKGVVLLVLTVLVVVRWEVPWEDFHREIEGTGCLVRGGVLQHAVLYQGELDQVAGQAKLLRVRVCQFSKTFQKPET